MSQEYRVVPAALLESALKTLAGVAPGRFAVEAELRAIVDAPVPHAFGEPWEILAWLVKDARDGQFSAHRHDPTGWAHGYQITELTDRAHVTRLQAENAALQQRLNVADQRVDELKSALKFYADKEHFHFDEPEKWDSVSGEAENLLWHEEDPAYIEDGSVARHALKVHP